MARPPVSELALARAWAAGALPSYLVTTTGVPVEIVFRGSWTHGSGPDFSGAMVSLPSGRLLTGSIEFHLVTSGWKQHGHHRDPAYNDVVLHLVGEDDGTETRRTDGTTVPVAVVGYDVAMVADGGLDWSRVGGTVCAEQLSATQPRLIVEALRQLGDRRLATKAAQFEAALTDSTPAQVLWAGLLDALGYQANRAPMVEMANLLRYLTIERELSLVDDRFATACALMLGVAGFLPLAPRDIAAGALSPESVSAIEREWERLRGVVDRPMRPTAWVAHRVRPANHPVVRLLVAAALLATSREGLTALLLAPLSAGLPVHEALVAMAGWHRVAIGQDRAKAITANVVLPFALALAGQSGDLALIEAASGAWEALPASAPNRVTKQATVQISGGAPLRGLGERGMQGLIHLNRALCEPRRCFECPVAALVLADDQSLMNEPA